MGSEIFSVCGDFHELFRDISSLSLIRENEMSYIHFDRLTFSFEINFPWLA